MATIAELFYQNEAKRQALIININADLDALHLVRLETVSLVTDGLLAAQEADEDVESDLNLD